MTKFFTVLQGLAIGTLIFLTAVFAMAAISAKVDTLVVMNKVADAIRTSEIQYPGKWDVNDKRGLDTFSDCFVLEVATLDHGRLWSDLFDTLIYNFGSRKHTCDVLVDRFGNNTTAPPVDLSSYNRYWWGSAAVAKIALGMTGLSIKTYRSLMLVLSWLALILLVVAFFVAYGRISVVFLPLFISLGVGYGLLTMGQSIAHAPEFIVGLLLLSAYCVGKVQQFSLRARAIFYSVLGGVCVYFDVMDSTVVLIAILLCCQLSAPYAARLLKPNKSQTAYSYTALAREIVINCSLVLIGGCIAIVARILGYSIVSHASVLEVATDWTSSLSYRIFGSLHDIGTNAQPSLRMLLWPAKHFRQYPFHGFFSDIAVDSFYVLSFASWAIAMLLCWKLHRKGVSPVTVALGIVMAAALVPAWFLVFLQHTIVHAWMTGRLVTPFCGLGMSLAVLAGWALARTHSSRGRGEPKLDFP
jgi:hypothetical protein